MRRATKRCPSQFSRDLYAKIKEIGKPVEYYEYKGDNHNMSGNFNTAMQRSLAFFDKYVKNAGKPERTRLEEEVEHSLLAVFAHPDDEAFGTGGTLARYASEGVATTLVCATRGEVGEIAEGTGATPETLGEVRENELRCAAETVGRDASSSSSATATRAWPARRRTSTRRPS